MSSSFKNAFKFVRSVLVERIDVSNGLLGELLDRKVLTSKHVDNIKAERTEGDRVEKLLDILERRSDKLLPAFKEALIATDQLYIWDDYLHKNTSAVPLHVSITSCSPESNLILANIDAAFAENLVCVADLLTRHIPPDEIASVKSNLQRPDLSLLKRDIVIAEFDEQIENVLRKHLQHDALVKARGISVALRQLMLYDLKLAFARESKSVEFFLLCSSIKDVNTVRKLVESGLLRRLLTDAVIQHIAPVDISVEPRLETDDYEIALSCFGVPRQTVGHVSLSNIGPQLPMELLEHVLMRTYTELIFLDCSFQPRLHAYPPYSSLPYDPQHAPYAPEDTFLGSQTSVYSDSVHSNIPVAYSALATVCNNWRTTMLGWQESTTRHWLKHKLKGFLEGSAILQLDAVRESLPKMLDPIYREMLPRVIGCSSSPNYISLEDFMTSSDIGDCVIQFSSVLKRERRCREFLLGLEESDQQHVVNYIRHKGVKSAECGSEWPLDEVRAAFLRSDTQLAENIDANDALLDNLFTSQSITYEECRKLKSFRGTLQRAKELLEILSRGSVATDIRFVECLATYKQHNAVQLLQTENSGAWYEAPSFLSTVRTLLQRIASVQVSIKPLEEKIQKIVQIAQSALRSKGKCQNLLRVDSFMHGDPSIKKPAGKAWLQLDVLAVMAAFDSDVQVSQVKTHPGYVKLHKAGVGEEQVPEKSARILLEALQKCIENEDEIRGIAKLRLIDSAVVEMEVLASAPSKANKNPKKQFSVNLSPCYRIDDKLYTVQPLHTEDSHAVCWRQCFYTEESAKWNQIDREKGSHGRVVDALKAVREVSDVLQLLPHHHFENAAFHVFDDKPSTYLWDSDRIGVRVIDILKELEECLGCGFMRDYFLPEANLLDVLSHDTIKNLRGYVHDLITSEGRLIALMKDYCETH